MPITSQYSPRTEGVPTLKRGSFLQITSGRPWRGTSDVFRNTHSVLRPYRRSRFLSSHRRRYLTSCFSMKFSAILPLWPAFTEPRLLAFSSYLLHLHFVSFDNRVPEPPLHLTQCTGFVCLFICLFYAFKYATWEAFYFRSYSVL